MAFDFADRLRKLSPSLLLAFNGILVVAGWSLAVYAYPRLPRRIPPWPRLWGGVPPRIDKSLWFFAWPLLQTAVAAGVVLLARRAARRAPSARVGQLRTERLFLTLIFVNLIFIHALRMLVGQAMGLVAVNWTYIAALFGFVVVIRFYYLWQERLSARLGDGDGCR